MKDDKLLLMFEQRIKELTEIKSKCRRDSFHLVEHSLVLNELLYQERLKRLGKFYVQPSSEIQ
jgi:hypothetical protein